MGRLEEISVSCPIQNERIIAAISVIRPYSRREILSRLSHENKA